MKLISIGLVMVALVALLTFDGSGQDQDVPSRGFLSVVKKGQPVNLKEFAWRWEINAFDDDLGPHGHKITEVGPDFIVLEDIAGATETRISVYSIKSIVKLKVPKK